jgi:O-antigen/teichoic acid export membrane protein
MSPAVLAARANAWLAPLSTVVASIASIFVVRILGPDIFADYAILMSLLAWILLIADGGANAGLSRYLKEASTVNARATFYHTLQFRRWGVVLIIVISLIWIGPFWVRTIGLSKYSLQSIDFVLVGLLAGVMLHGQLASSALLSIFRHRDVLLTNQCATITRALILTLLATILRKPTFLLVALFICGLVEAFILNSILMNYIGRERSVLPYDFVNASQKHGLVGVFDKSTSALSAGPFLILILAGSQAPIDLAMLAIACDLLQKVLSVSALPLSNIVMPIFNNSRNDVYRFRVQVTRLGGLMVVLFSLTIGFLVVALPKGLPLLLGDGYLRAVPIALIWLLPLFFEAGVRMIWGAALISLDEHSWLMKYNILYACASLFIVFLFRHADLNMLILFLGIMRFCMGFILLHRALKISLLPPDSRPLRVLIISILACTASLSLQSLPFLTSSVSALLLGISSYCLFMLSSLRFLQLVPPPSHDALCEIAGNHKNLLLRIIPSPI